MADLVLCICGESASTKKGTDYFVHCECGWGSAFFRSAEEAIASWNAVMTAARAARAARYGHCAGCTDPRSEGTHCEGTYEHPEVPR